MFKNYNSVQILMDLTVYVLSFCSNALLLMAFIVFFLAYADMLQHYFHYPITLVNEPSLPFSFLWIASQGWCVFISHAPLIYLTYNPHHQCKQNKRSQIALESIGKLHAQKKKANFVAKIVSLSCLRDFIRLFVEPQTVQHWMNLWFCSSGKALKLWISLTKSFSLQKGF